MLPLRPNSSTHGWHRYRMPIPALPSRLVPFAWWAWARSSNTASSRSKSVWLRCSARTTRLPGKKHASTEARASSLRNKNALRRNLAAQQVAWCKLALRNRPRGWSQFGRREAAPEEALGEAVRVGPLVQGPLEVGVHITKPARLPGLHSAIYSAAKQVIEEDLCNAWMASRLVRTLGVGSGGSPKSASPEQAAGAPAA